jgi:hypothetical protein
MTGRSSLLTFNCCWQFQQHQVPLDGGSRPSQNDIWALARASMGLVPIAVEGKVPEPFGPTLSEWLAEGSKGKASRLAFLRRELNLNEALAGTIEFKGQLTEFQQLNAPDKLVIFALGRLKMKGEKCR